MQVQLLSHKIFVLILWQKSAQVDINLAVYYSKFGAINSICEPSWESSNILFTWRVHKSYTVLTVYNFQTADFSQTDYQARYLKTKQILQ